MRANGIGLTFENQDTIQYIAFSARHRARCPGSRIGCDRRGQSMLPPHRGRPRSVEPVNYVSPATFVASISRHASQALRQTEQPFLKTIFLLVGYGCGTGRGKQL